MNRKDIKMLTIDQTDIAILNILQQDTSLAVADIARRVGLSVTPCWRRIQRLEEQGVIRRRVALLNGEKIGAGLSVFVAIRDGPDSRYVELQKPALPTNRALKRHPGCHRG